MLKVYAQAVKVMKTTAGGDPRSWLFQWYTHFVNGDTDKDAEITRLYNNPMDPNRAAAVAMWNTCQAHSDGQNEDFFLPWHRCFVFYFEKIVATVSGRPDFALPYWNYSTDDSQTRGVIPPQFAMQDDPDFGSLFDGKRRNGVNAGNPIQQGSTGDPLALSALTQTTYSPNGAEAGFCQELDFGLHGAVHVLVGGPTNMGSVPYAAQDPIFWMHHSNIDRLWASWNAAGYTNPPLDQTFTFADGTGMALQANISDYLDLSKLDYSYDRFEPVPGAIPHANAQIVAPPAKESIAATGEKGGVVLAAKPVQVPLAPASQVSSVAVGVAKLAPGRKIHLVASGLATKVQPGVLYSLYLDLPENPTKQQLADHRVGTINFFGVQHGGHGAAAMGRQRFISFDVTGKVRALGRSKTLTDKPVLTIIPEGEPAASAQPVLGKVELVAQ
jgi:tyrosinase